MVRKPLIAGNWKMNGNRHYVDELSREIGRSDINDIDIVICPPSCYLSFFNSNKISLAAQDVSSHDNGAHTGELSASMLRESGCEYVIVGHSERRQAHNETDGLVVGKVLQALAENLKPIICIGETLAARVAGKQQESVSLQLDAVLNELNTEQIGECIFAYEPIWAIGSGKTATPEEAQSVHSYIRELVSRKNETVANKIRILYGGSVNPDNAQQLFAQNDIDGGLIGGASLNSDSFIAICKAASGDFKNVFI